MKDATAIYASQYRLAKYSRKYFLINKLKKEFTMKSLLQFNRQKLLSKRTGWLFAIVFTIATVFTGCKKDSPPSCDDFRFALKGKNAVAVVHNGQSIQAAIDAAVTNEVIYIEPGIYKEVLTVNKPGIQLIGSACNAYSKVIIQNPGDGENGITVQDAGDGFTLKNITIQDFEENGIILIRVDNFTLSHVTAINDGEYGLFPVLCSNGVVEYCSATGDDDTGIYVGQSTNVVIQYCEAFANVNGIEIENCTNVVAQKNHSYNNVAGFLIDLLPGKTVKTSSDVLITDNIIEGNNHVNFADPEGGFEAFVPSGSGVLVVGVDNVTIKNNKITNNNFTGIATVSTIILGALAGLPPEAFADIEPNAGGAKITDNIVLNNGSAPPTGLPLPGVDLLWDGSGMNNCWKNNTHNSEYPSPLPSCN